MADLTDILADNWDGTVATEPSIINGALLNYRFYQRIVMVQEVVNIDQIIGVVDRSYFDPDAHDAYNCIVVSTTSRADLKNMITAIKKVCATYSPTSAENILQWNGGEWHPFNGMRWVFRFTILVRRAGIAAY